MGKPIFRGNLSSLAMRECATVDEVISLYKSYNLKSQRMEYYQLMFADRQGNSVIIEGDRFHLNRREVQVVTGFYLSTLKKDQPIPCKRYKIARTMLKKYPVNVTTFEKILGAVSQNLGTGRTIYSNIYDVRKGIIYIYYFGNFTRPVIIHLQEELKKGYRKVDFNRYFKATSAVKAFKNAYQKRIHRFRLPGIGLLISGLIFILALVFILFFLLASQFNSIAEKIKVNHWKDATPRFFRIWLICHAAVGILGTGFLFLDIPLIEILLKRGLEIPSYPVVILISWAMLLLTVVSAVFFINIRKKNSLPHTHRILIIILIINSLYLIIHHITWGFFHLA